MQTVNLQNYFGWWKRQGLHSCRVDPSEPRKFYVSVVVKSVVEARLHAVEWVEHMVERFITTFCVYLHEFSEQIDSKKRETFSENLHVYDQVTMPSSASIFHSTANWKTFFLPLANYGTLKLFPLFKKNASLCSFCSLLSIQFAAKICKVFFPSIILCFKDRKREKFSKEINSNCFSSGLFTFHKLKKA